MEVSTTMKNRHLIVLSGFLPRLQSWASALGINVILRDARRRLGVPSRRCVLVEIPSRRRRPRTGARPNTPGRRRGTSRPALRSSCDDDETQPRRYPHHTLPRGRRYLLSRGACRVGPFEVSRSRPAVRTGRARVRACPGSRAGTPRVRVPEGTRGRCSTTRGRSGRRVRRARRVRPARG